MSDAGGAPPVGGARVRVRVWDWPTRAFHWLLVVLIPASWWTAQSGRTALHATLGVVMAGLVLFRLIWGVVGGSTARFANFLRGPRAVLSYLNGRAAQELGQKPLGHNPLGGWSVAAMLLVLTMQVGLGLFAVDGDGIVAGPLAGLVSLETSESLTERHATLFNLLLALIALHVLAIGVYALRRRNLVTPMLTGRAEAIDGAGEMVTAAPVRLAAALAAAVGVAAWLWTRL